MLPVLILYSHVPPSLTSTNSTFCPRSVFTCFVRISEQTAIISLYSINWLVYITETGCVHCAVRTGSLYIIQIICFVWISEQKAVISLYSIDWLVYITETGCVHCAVRTGCLTFRHRASSICDSHFATLQKTLFIFLINKYISLSDIYLTVRHWYK